MREIISDVLSQQVSGNLLKQPWETNTTGSCFKALLFNIVLKSSVPGGGVRSGKQGDKI